jgi:hypothetical protein
MAISLYWNNFHTKFASIALFIILANCVYFSLDGVKGWPAEEPREVKGTIASVVIVNPSESFEGAIYVGVFLSEENKWYEYDYPRISPKTFYVKYSNNRAAEFEKAKKAIQEGKEVRIDGIPPMESQGEGEEYDGIITDISSMIGDLIAKIMMKQEDTYEPGRPKGIEIVEPGSPPSKGTSE